MPLTQQALPGPETVHRSVLSNGLILLVRENRLAPLVVLEGYIPAGAVHDPAGKTGLASFTASMLSRGSQRHDFQAFNEKVESVGASLTVGSGTHVTNFSIECLTEDFPMLVDLLGDVLRQPTFPEEQMERLRQQWLVRLQQREQDTRSVAYRHFSETIYGDHPYAPPTSGYPETIQSLTRSDLVAFQQERYTPNGAIIVVSGDVSAGEVEALMEQVLGDWAGDPAPLALPPVRPIPAVQRVTVPMPGKVQSDIVLGWLAIARHSPDYYPVQVANHILGRFGMMGRLGETVREEQGLAYYSYSLVDAEVEVGPWLAVAGVNPIYVDQAVESILREFQRLREEPVSAQELADSQANMTGILPLRLETNEGVASTLLAMEYYDLGLDYLLRYSERINQVTVEDVQRVAQTYLHPEQYTLVVAGPAGE